MGQGLIYCEECGKAILKERGKVATEDGRLGAYQML